MTPTQAQIEAALQKLRNCLAVNSNQNICNFQHGEVIALIAALTAAAEVGEPTQTQIEAAKAIWLNNHPMLDGKWEDYLKDAEVALTAAAIRAMKDQP